MKKTIEIEVYQAPDGKPSCAKNIYEGKFCIFLRLSHFGTRSHCAFAENEVFIGKNKFIEPDKACPLWRNQDANN
jgi:hypothetical protein